MYVQKKTILQACFAIVVSFARTANHYIYNNMYNYLYNKDNENNRYYSYNTYINIWKYFILGSYSLGTLQNAFLRTGRFAIIVYQQINR